MYRSVEVSAQTALIIFLGSLFFLIPHIVLGATLSLVPPSGTYPVGTVFSTTVEVVSDGEGLNAVSGALAFPADTMEVVSLSKGGSIISLWVQEPSFSNTNGTVIFEGVVPSPGYASRTGKVITILFRIKTPSSPKVSFITGSVLANNGEGTELLTRTFPANYVSSVGDNSESGLTDDTISPSNNATNTRGAKLFPTQITSKSHPQGQWSRHTTGTFFYKIPKETLALRMVLDDASATMPGNTPILVTTFQEIKNLAEGISYIHVQYKTLEGWSEVAHYIIRVDATPPLPFNIVEQQSGTFTFSTTDALSGIERYDVAVDDSKSTTLIGDTGQSFVIPPLPHGTHRLVVTAVDTAGNTRESRIAFMVTANDDLPNSSFFTNFLHTGMMNIILITLVLPFLGVVIIIGMLLYFISRTSLSARTKVMREVVEAKKIIHRAFALLHNDIEDDISLLEKAGTTRSLTDEEVKILHRLQKNMHEAEKVISQEIADIEILTRP